MWLHPCIESCAPELKLNSYRTPTLIAAVVAAFVAVRAAGNAVLASPTTSRGYQSELIIKPVSHVVGDCLALIPSAPTPTTAEKLNSQPGLLFR